jgi:hypothetical protein
MSEDVAVFRAMSQETLFAGAAGVAAVVIGLALGGAAGVTLIALGIVIFALAGAAHRWTSLGVRAPGMSLDAKLAEKEHGKEFKEAAEDAPDNVLEAAIPLLREDAASDVLELGQSFDKKQLIDPDLAWLRQELNLTVFAVQRPTDGDRWIGGGQVSTLALPKGTRLAVVGDRADIERAKERIAQ